MGQAVKPGRKGADGMDDFMVNAADLLQGAYDLHTHTTPSHVKRALDDFQLLQEAGNAGMAGVMLKSHYETTHARAAIANQYASSSAKAFGAIVLNHTVGGLNPEAVENALDGGARMVWMPTMDAAHCQRGDMGAFYSRPGIRVLDQNGALKSCIYDIFELCKKHEVPLATGHISIEEAVVLCKEGVGRGVTMILTHPEWPKTTVPLPIQKELAHMGVYVEKLWLNVAERSVTPEYMAETIRTVGAEHAFLSTDRGQAGAEHPVEGLKQFIAEMLKQGISENDIWKMTHDTPRFLMRDERKDVA